MWTIAINKQLFETNDAETCIHILFLSLSLSLFRFRFF